MSKERIAVVDADDLWYPEQIEEVGLLKLKEMVPDLRVTLYGIPNQLGPVQILKNAFPWITFGIHGWEHGFAECRSWTDEEGAALIERALEMGYDPVFKPPQWIFDIELEIACEATGVVLHHHKKDKVSGLPKLKSYCEGKGEKHTYVHTHIQKNPSTDYIETHPRFTVGYLNRFDRFATPLEMGQ